MKRIKLSLKIYTFLRYRVVVLKLTITVKPCLIKWDTGYHIIESDNLVNYHVFTLMFLFLKESGCLGMQP